MSFEYVSLDPNAKMESEIISSSQLYSCIQPFSKKCKEANAVLLPSFPIYPHISTLKWIRLKGLGWWGLDLDLQRPSPTVQPVKNNGFACITVLLLQGK